MMVTILDLTLEILKTGLPFLITRDSRSLIPGGPVDITITRHDRPLAKISLKTLNPIDQPADNVDAYFITHATIDEAATFRVPKTLSAEDLWSKIYQIRLEAIPPPMDYYQQSRPPQAQFRRAHRPHPRYRQRPSKHLRQTTA
jgi:hypothetical protein